MKDKMVLSCLELKENSFRPLKQRMFTFTIKTFQKLKTVPKNVFKKYSKTKRGNCFNRETIVLIVLQI